MARIDIKSGAKLPPIARLVVGLANAAEAIKIPLTTITSGNDSLHKKGSLHYVDKAIDIRTRDLTKQQQVAFVAALKTSLGTDYDVILEKDHIHAEYDPK